MTGHFLREDLWCIALVHQTGGGACPWGDTPEQAREAARRLCERHPKAYVLATIPYPVRRRKGPPDVTVPAAIKADWSPEVLRLYGGDGV